MIIDAHSHWLPEEIIKNAHFFNKDWGNIESHVNMMDEAGVNWAVLSYPTSDAHFKLNGQERVARIFNDNVGKILKRHPDRFIGAAALPVDNSAQDMLEELKRAREELGFKAISLASSYSTRYLDDPNFFPVYNYAHDNKIPIFVHSQIINPIGYERVQDPLLTPVVEYVFDTTICVGKLLMAGVLRDLPDLKFIFSYFGGVALHLAQRFDATYSMLRGINFVKDLGGDPSDFLKNIYVDTSGDMNRNNFQAALDLLGPKHILWGSDWPAKRSVSDNIRAVGAMGLPEEDKKAILGGNLAAML